LSQAVAVEDSSEVAVVELVVIAHLLSVSLQVVGRLRSLG
jgi:hypothetical protein